MVFYLVKVKKSVFKSAVLVKGKRMIFGVLSVNKVKSQFLGVPYQGK
mgnify:FL=1